MLRHRARREAWLWLEKRVLDAGRDVYVAAVTGWNPGG
jgi:hypothetical protein